MAEKENKKNFFLSKNRGLYLQKSKMVSWPLLPIKKGE